jgi:Excreted virulence factor EspC, type VII ESX diderm
MSSVEGDPNALHELATFLADSGDALASRRLSVGAGPIFQPSTSAVSAVHDSVTSAQGRLADRMAATSARVRTATQNYGETEDSSTAALRAVGQAHEP